MRWPVSAPRATSLPHYYRTLIRSCTRQSSLQHAQTLHAFLLKSGFLTSPSTFLNNTLLHLYATCDLPSLAHQLFDEIPNTHKDTIDYTTLMSSYTRNRLPHQTLHLFSLMQQQQQQQQENGKIYPDDVTFVSVFSACSRLGDIVNGTLGFGYMVKSGLVFTVTVCNAAMDMYVKSGRMNDARRVFDEMKEKSVVSYTVILTGVIKWEGVVNGRKLFDEMPMRNEVAYTVMIAGYIGNGFTREAFVLIREMVLGVFFELNHVTLCSFLSACSLSGDLLMGRWVHAYAVKNAEKRLHLMVETALVDMYSKCGRIEVACRVFESMTCRNVVAWNAILGGLAMHGRGKDVLKFFSRMVEDVKPDDVTFVSVLSACNHSGLVEEGSRYFKDLGQKYGITPKIEHYACVVDLLGRAGRLEEAECVAREMPISPNEVVLGSLLAASALHGRLLPSERLLQELIQIDPLNTEYHVILSNMYTLAGRLDEASSLRQALKNRGITKVPGMSSLHLNGQVHRFSSGDKSHPQTQDIYIMLDKMIQRLRLAGYVPNTASQVLSVSEIEIDDLNVKEEKERALFSHSEKLAISFGLLSTRPGMPLHIFKNLRICQDCHSAVKLISEIYNREIIIRDRNRFHCFRHGSCSCADYW